MTIIAFDVAKQELVGVRTTKRAQVEEEYILPNTEEAIAPFLDGVRTRYARLTIASEATAEYHVVLARACLTRRIPFRLVNPLLTKQFTRATVRKQKTDRTDALVIAKLVLQGEGTLLTPASLDPRKALSRTAFKLQRMALMAQAMAARFRRVFPEDGESNTILADSVRSLSVSVTAMREGLRERIDPVLSELLMSLPGVGPTVASTLITEISAIERFPSGKALVAYAGLDPRVRQSGVSLRRNTGLTKRGSPYLRKALFIAAAIAKRHDPELQAHYEKKRREGKAYKEAVIATARKLLYRVYAVWKRGTPYVKLPVSLSTETA